MKMLKNLKFWPKIAQNRQNHANYACRLPQSITKNGRVMTKMMVDYFYSVETLYEILYFSCRNSEIFGKKYCVKLGEVFFLSKSTKNGQKYVFFPQICILKLLIPTK